MSNIYIFFCSIQYMVFSFSGTCTNINRAQKYNMHVLRVRMVNMVKPCSKETCVIYVDYINLTRSFRNVLPPAPEQISPPEHFMVLLFLSFIAQFF